jgi:anhydro-N-acetylmuramic acid kinase
VLLNIGGIANLTWLPGDGDFSRVLCTDLGPGNTLIDAACRKYFNKPYDEDSAIAYSGSVNEQLLTALLAHPFFKEKAPKTTGPELFNLTMVVEAQQQSGTGQISNEDLVCTLSAFTAASIAGFIKENISGDQIKIFTSGGGARNPFVIGELKKLLPEAALLTIAVPWELIPMPKKLYCLLC